MPKAPDFHTGYRGSDATLREASATKDLGAVVGNKVAAGTSPAIASVALVESAGGVDMPDVLTLSQYSAVNLLAAQGFVVGIGYQKACIDPGNVIDQSPYAGAVVAIGATVHITVDSATSGTCIIK